MAQLDQVSSSTIAGLQDIPDGVRLAVVGDLMVDHYVYGNVNRVSPEAPVPVLDVRRSEKKPGGAANVAENLLALGADVTLIGRVGDDEDGRFLRSRFTGRAELGLVVFPGWRTERKSRYMAGPVQLLRVDDRTSNENDNTSYHAVMCKLAGCLLSSDEIKGVVISDYNKGLFDQDLIVEVCRQHSWRRFFLDCKPATFARWPSCADMTFKPNLHEFEALGGVLDDGLIRNADRFCMSELLVTRGADGMTLAYNSGRDQYRLPSMAQEVFSVVGAGDTVLATYAWARVGGMDPVPAAVLANVAAAEVVRHAGTATIGREQLLEAVETYLTGLHDF